jgi:hypothetical protein
MSPAVRNKGFSEPNDEISGSPAVRNDDFREPSDEDKGFRETSSEK